MSEFDNPVAQVGSELDSESTGIPVQEQLEKVLGWTGTNAMYAINLEDPGCRCGSSFTIDLDSQIILCDVPQGDVPQELVAIGWTLDDWTKLLGDLEAALSSVSGWGYLKIVLVLGFVASLLLGGFATVTAQSEEERDNISYATTAAVICFGAAMMVVGSLIERKLEATLAQIRVPHGCAIQHHKSTLGNGENSVTYQFVVITLLPAE